MKSDDSEPMIVLVLYCLAVLSVFTGIFLGIATGGAAGAYYGLTIGLGGGLGWWALGTIIEQLHQIMLNTRPGPKAAAPIASPAPASRPKPSKQEPPADTYKL
jgi:hypothetical protein